MNSQKLVRLQYDKNSLELIRREREALALESAELERKMKDWEKLKHAQASFQAAKLAEFKARLEEKTKEHDRMVKIKSSSKFEDEEIEVLKPNQASLQNVQEEKVEVNRPVKHAQVEVPAKAINRRLRLKRIRIEDALEALFWVSPEDASVAPGEIGIYQLENNLRREPFWLQKKEQRLVARYLVEDNYADHIQFNPQRTQLRIIVSTIFKTMVGHYDLPDLSRVREHFLAIERFLKKCRNTLLQVFINKERKEVITAALFEEKLEKMPHAMMLDFSQECKDIFVLHAVERSENPEDIEFEKIFSFFGADSFDSLYPPGFEAFNSSKATPIYMRSVSRTKTTGKGLYPYRPAAGARTPQQSSRDHSDLGSRDDFQKPLQNKPGKDKHLDVLSEDLSQPGEGEDPDLPEEQDMPVPKLSINTVETFNNPLTQEIIYKLEQIRVSKEVTVALEKIVFEGMFAEQALQGGDPDLNDESRQDNPKTGAAVESENGGQVKAQREAPISFPLDLSKIVAHTPVKQTQNSFFDPNKHIPEDPNDDDEEGFDDPNLLDSQERVQLSPQNHSPAKGPDAPHGADSSQKQSATPIGRGSEKQLAEEPPAELEEF